MINKHYADNGVGNQSGTWLHAWVMDVVVCMGWETSNANNVASNNLGSLCPKQYFESQSGFYCKMKPRSFKCFHFHPDFRIHPFLEIRSDSVWWSHSLSLSQRWGNIQWEREEERGQESQSGFIIHGFGSKRTPEVCAVKSHWVGERNVCIFSPGWSSDIRSEALDNKNLSPRSFRLLVISWKSASGRDHQRSVSSFYYLLRPCNPPLKMHRIGDAKLL